MMRPLLEVVAETERGPRVDRGQVVGKVVSLASDLEDSLVKLLVQAAPPEQAQKVVVSTLLNGPVVNPEGRSDIVHDQGEVDDLLASLGF